MRFTLLKPSSICSFCGFERREGDAHLVYFDPMPSCDPSRMGLPTFGCGIVVEVQHPQRLGIITGDMA